jgi:hypothetical protein
MIARRDLDDRRRINPDLLDQVRELRAQGVAYRSIQAITGVTVPTIRAHTRDVPLPPGECPYCGRDVDRGSMNVRVFCSTSHRIMHGRRQHVERARLEAA